MTKKTKWFLFGAAALWVAYECYKAKKYWEEFTF